MAIALGAASLYYHRDHAEVSAPEVVPMPVAPAPRNSPLQAPPAPLESAPPHEALAAVQPAASESISVAAMGAVQCEGLYTMPAGSRVGDIIRKAGGLAGNADQSDLNLAAPLIDGTTLTVPEKGGWTSDGGALRGTSSSFPRNPPQYLRSYVPGPISTPAQPAQPGTPAAATAGSRLININTASPEELEKLPGVGPKIAESIVQQRPYANIDALIEVKGIGPKKMEQLRPFITVQ